MKSVIALVGGLAALAVSSGTEINWVFGKKAKNSLVAVKGFKWRSVAMKSG